MDAKWITPSVTAFKSGGTVDLEGCSTVYRNLIDNGMDGILVLGSLGEFFALPMEKKKEIVKNAVKTVNGRVQLIIGTNCTVLDESIAFSRYALEQGADAVMVVPPYYFKMPDASVLHFYDQLAENVDGPIYLYNFPGVTGYDLKPEVIAKIALKHENIIGLKDTLISMDHTRAVIRLIKEKRPDFEVFSGFDENFAHNLLSGGSGCIAGTSNFAPEVASGFVKAARGNDLAEMMKYQQKIDTLMAIYSIGEQFTPIVKKAMVLRGIIESDQCAAPLLSATQEETEKIRQLLERAGLGSN